MDHFWERATRSVIGNVIMDHFVNALRVPSSGM